jgi:putative sporulation protein YtaF
LLIALSLSLDAFGAGIAYGIRKIRIPPVSKLVICFMSVFYSGIALVAGKAAGGILPPAAAKAAGTVILASMGVYIILQTFLKKEKPVTERSRPQKGTLLEIAIKSLGVTIQVVRNPDSGDIDRSGIIDIREALLLGFALSVDAIGVGIGSALAGIHSMMIPFAAGLFQLLLLSAGTRLGGKLEKTAGLNKKVLAVVPGILLITMALIRIR